MPKQSSSPARSVTPPSMTMEEKIEEQRRKTAYAAIRVGKTVMPDSLLPTGVPRGRSAAEQAAHNAKIKADTLKHLAQIDAQREATNNYQTQKNSQPLQTSLKKSSPKPAAKAAAKPAVAFAAKPAAKKASQKASQKPEPKRGKKVYKNNILRVTKHAVRRLARCGGVKRITGTMYEEIRGILKNFVEGLVRDSVTYSEHGKRTTVTALDVVYALRKRGRMLYGYN